MREQAEKLAGRRNAATGGQATRLNNDLSRLLSRFAEEIASLRILDPACGSGNFLGVSLKQLLNSEKEVIAFARDHDSLFGVLHSQVHELWALRMGTSLEDRPRYTPTTCFETFPLPWPPGDEPDGDSRIEEIAEAARRLDELRRNWLNPEGASEKELKKRTLTDLYNARPTWLENAHQRLDAAVFAAYAWPLDPTDEEMLENLLALNLERAGEGDRRDDST